MDSDRKRRIEEKVQEILSSADMDTMTERMVRDLAAESLAVDLSDFDSMKLVREVVEAFLLSTCDDGGGDRVNGGAVECDENKNANSVGERRDGVKGDGLQGKEKSRDELSEEQPEARGRGGEAPAKKSGDDEMKFVCKLSNKRSLAIKDSGGEKVVLLGEFYWKDGKQVPGYRGISLTAEQWPIFRKSIPAIEEAIRKVESHIRSDLERKQIGSHERCEPNNGDIYHGPEFKKQKPDICLASEVGQKQIEKKPATTCTTSRLNPIEIVRFDGKNYHDWARRMELFLKQLKLAYVLTEPCPTAAAGANAYEIPQIMDVAQKWMDDDYVCHTNILNTLSDHLFEVYSKKGGTAKELWDELKLIYLTNEQSSKVSLVKKYMEFQMVEGKSVFDQVQQLHEIANSLVPHGMHVEENFHVNAIVSKLPPSWKGIGVKLMRENNLPVWMLMNHLKQEEEFRARGNTSQCPSITADGAESPRGGKGSLPAYKNRVGFQPQNNVLERERKARFCTICQRKGHVKEKCWNKSSKYERGNNSTSTMVVMEGEKRAAE